MSDLFESLLSKAPGQVLTITERRLVEVAERFLSQMIIHERCSGGPDDGPVPFTDELVLSAGRRALMLAVEVEQQLQSMTRTVEQLRNGKQGTGDAVLRGGIDD